MNKFNIFTKQFVTAYNNELDIIDDVANGKGANLSMSSLVKSSVMVEQIKKIAKITKAFNLKYIFLDANEISNMANSSLQNTSNRILYPELADFVKSCEKLLDRREANRENFTKFLVEGCFELFHSYEAQMLTLQSEIGYREAIKRLVQYSVKCSIYHLKDNPDSTIAMSVYLGKCEDDAELQFENGNSINCQNFFLKPGVRVDDSGGATYYKKVESDIHVYGFRRLFAWEDAKKIYKIIDPECAFLAYQYVLDIDDKPMYINQAMKLISSNPNQVSEKSTEAKGHSKRVNFNPRRMTAIYSRIDTDKTKEILKELKKGTRVALVGESGIGKTIMAANIAEKLCRMQALDVIWIDATDINTITECVHRLCREELRIDIRDNDEVIDIKQLFEITYNSFNDEKTLFIFDDAKDLSSIEFFFPASVMNFQETPMFLVTSINPNNSDWESDYNKIHVVHLEGFNEAESLSYLKSQLNISDKSQDNALKSLSEHLKNDPWALSLAASKLRVLKENLQVRKQMFDVGSNVEIVLQTCKEGKQKILISLLDKIKEEQHGQMALDMFHIMSYLSCYQIPEDIFLGCLSDNDQDLQINITKNLLKYSLLTFEGVMLNVHGLLQEITRSKLQSESMDTELLGKILQWFLATIKSTEDGVNTTKKKEDDDEKASIKFVDDKLSKYIPHIVSVWNHAIQYDEFVKMFIINDIIGKKPHLSFFHIIFGYSSYEVAEKILEKIPKNRRQNIINMKSYITKKSSLHYAVESGCERKVAILLQNKSEINAKTNLKHTPLHLAARNNILPILQLLLDNDNIQFDCLTTYNFTPLHFAAKMGHYKAVEMLLERVGKNVDMKTYINAKSKFGFTALHMSSERGHSEVVYALLTNDEIDIDALTNYGETSLFLAVKYGHVEVVKALLKKSADPNLFENTKKPNYGPLHEAIARKNLELVRILGTYFRTKFNDEALRLARNSQSEDIIDVVEYCYSRQVAIK